MRVHSRRDRKGFAGVTRAQLKRIRDTLQLSGTELANLFGVSRQAVEQWETKSVPIDKAAKVDRVAEVVDGLAQRFKPQRLPIIVRNPMPILNDRSILPAAGDGASRIGLRRSDQRSNPCRV